MSVVQFWKLDDNAASTTVVATTGTNGTLLGGDNTSVKHSSGPGTAITSSFDMNGIDDAIDISAAAFSRASGTAFSVEAFMNFDQTTGFLVGINGSTNSRIGKSSDTQLAVNATAYTVPSLSTTAFHHILVTRTTGNVVKVYCDGVQSTTAGVTMAITFAPTRIGLSNTTFNDGQISWVRFYDSDESANAATLSAARDLPKTGFATPTAIATDSAVGSAAYQGHAAPAAVAMATATGSATHYGHAAPVAVATDSATGSSAYQGHAAPVAIATATATGSATHQGSVSPAAIAEAEATGAAEAAGSAAATSIAVAEATGEAPAVADDHFGDATVDAPAAIIVVGAAEHAGSCSVTAKARVRAASTIAVDETLVLLGVFLRNRPKIKEHSGSCGISAIATIEARGKTNYLPPRVLERAPAPQVPVLTPVAGWDYERLRQDDEELLMLIGDLV